MQPGAGQEEKISAKISTFDPNHHLTILLLLLVIIRSNSIQCGHDQACHPVRIAGKLKAFHSLIVNLYQSSSVTVALASKTSPFNPFHAEDSAVSRPDHHTALLTTFGIFARRKEN